MKIGIISIFLLIYKYRDNFNICCEINYTPENMRYFDSTNLCLIFISNGDYDFDTTSPSRSILLPLKY